MKVRKMSDRVFEVGSESEDGKAYTVWFDPFRGSWMCSCTGYAIHLKPCKHILRIQKAVAEGVVTLGP
ncbi:MAG: hypothetical protein QXT64_01535 [Desulfurococcaceae archaeon]